MLPNAGKAAQSKQRLPVPEDAVQQKVLATIRDTYRADYKAADRAALARKLLQKADENKSDPVARFVLLLEAKNVAAKAGENELAFQAIDTMAAEYNISAVQLKAGVIETGAAMASSPRQCQTLIDAARRTIDDAIREDNFAAGRQVGRQVVQLARLTKDRGLVQEAMAKSNAVEAAAKAYSDIQGSMATLKENPNDPDSNLAVGKYLCCTKNDWELGLPMLAKGSNAALKALAARDLQGPATPQEQVVLGDGWWEFADSEQAAVKEQFQERAANGTSRRCQGWWGSSKTRRKRGCPATPIRRGRPTRVAAWQRSSGRDCTISGSGLPARMLPTGSKRRN